MSTVTHYDVIRENGGGSLYRAVREVESDENAPSAPWVRLTAAEYAAEIAAQPVPVPTGVTRRQLLLALYDAAGLTEDAILAQLGAIADAPARYRATTEFKHATEFARAHPLVAQLASDLSLTSAQVDDIFRAAAAL